MCRGCVSGLCVGAVCRGCVSGLCVGAVCRGCVCRGCVSGLCVGAVCRGCARASRLAPGKLQQAAAVHGRSGELFRAGHRWAIRWLG
ncbi:MAG: hypothetical protein EAZ82_11580 [Verrucomicrobia bacterium]|nr:MAG: hypothetical protein EAZ82_11580 [Verrucomicrobiota bacterium]